MRTLNVHNGLNPADPFYDENMTVLQREITAENALIENTFTQNRTGFVTISYGVTDRNQIIQMRVVTLVVGSHTRIWDQFGRQTGFRDLQEDMIVNARFVFQYDKKQSSTGKSLQYHNRQRKCFISHRRGQG